MILVSFHDGADAPNPMNYTLKTYKVWCKPSPKTALLIRAASPHSAREAAKNRWRLTSQTGLVVAPVGYARKYVTAAKMPSAEIL